MNIKKTIIINKNNKLVFGGRDHRLASGVIMSCGKNRSVDKRKQ